MLIIQIESNQNWVSPNCHKVHTCKCNDIIYMIIKNAYSSNMGLLDMKILI